VCLGAGKGRRPGVRALGGGGRADLVELSRAAVGRARRPFPPAEVGVPRVGRGALLLGGGGPMGLGVWKKFVELAGGPSARLVVVPTGLPDPLPREPVEVRGLRWAGARDVVVWHTRDRVLANSEGFVAPLRGARGVWFSGGRTWRFVDAYEGTLAEKAFHEVLGRGGVIGGSSAGASVQSEYMPRGSPVGNREIMAEGYERGFGFLKGAAVDQHFFARRRERDMSELMARYPQFLGVGVDEGTAVVVRGTTMEVIGVGRVGVYDRRKRVPAGGPDYETLWPGQRYDLVKRRRVE
jgi:cyanophycinase